MWRLVALYPETVLVTGDQALIDAVPSGVTVISPRRYLTLIGRYAWSEEVQRGAVQQGPNHLKAVTSQRAVAQTE
jgi:hypothetical protein